MDTSANAMSSRGSHNQSHTLKRQWQVITGRERVRRKLQGEAASTVARTGSRQNVTGTSSRSNFLSNSEKRKVGTGVRRDLIPGTKLTRKVVMEERRTAHRYRISVAVVVRRQSNAMAPEFVPFGILILTQRRSSTPACPVVA